MHLDTKEFLDFLNELVKKKLLTDKEIDESLYYLDGLNEVLNDRLFISAYENIAWYLTDKYQSEIIKKFVEENKRLLNSNEGAKYFFCQALLDQNDLSHEERKNIIRVMPEGYQRYLLKRFGYS